MVHLINNFYLFGLFCYWQIIRLLLRNTKVNVIKVTLSTASVHMQFQTWYFSDPYKNIVVNKIF
jgi:hypothetical protein